MEEKRTKNELGEILCSMVTIILTVLSIVFAVVCSSLNNASAVEELYWIVPMLGLLVMSVITLAGVTLKKTMIVKTFMIVFLSVMTLTFAILTITYASDVARSASPLWFNITSFALSMVSLVVVIFYFVYYIAFLKNLENALLLGIVNIFLLFLLLCYVATIIVYIATRGSAYNTFPPIHYITMPLALLSFAAMPLFLVFKGGQNKKRTDSKK
ncbi:MAG: hypothetical protein WC366_01220 [Bacilli bacterium]|jgi:hypothetical protein